MTDTVRDFTYRPQRLGQDGVIRARVGTAEEEALLVELVGIVCGTPVSVTDFDPANVPSAYEVIDGLISDARLGPVDPEVLARVEKIAADYL